MALELGLGLPVGSAEAFARDEGPRLSARLQVGRRFGWLRPALEAEVLRRSSAAIGLPEDPRPLLGREVRLAAALALLGEGLRGEVGARATLPLEHSRNALEVLGGLHYPVLPELEVFALGGLGFGSAPGTPLYRAAAGLSFGSAPLPEPELHLPERVMPGQAPPRTPSPRRPAVSTSSMAPWPPDEAPPGEDTGEEDTGEDAPDERQPDARRTKP
jgi:hypothetical protein